MRTIDETRDIPDSNAFACANIVIEDGQFKTRPGFDKVMATKLGAAINGIYDYRGRTGSYFPIIGGGGNVYQLLGWYVVVCDDPITSGVNFTMTITAYNLFGNRDYTYNGTANLTENGDGALGTATMTFIQGLSTIATQTYSGSAGSLLITATDNSDSTVYGSDAVTVTVAAFSNLALGQPCTASSDIGLPYSPGGAVSGSDYPAWIATSGSNEWWRVDLGSNKTCTRWKWAVVGGGAPVGSQTGILEYSLNDSDWLTADTFTNDSGANAEKSFTAKTGRYWRYNCSGTDGMYIGIGEFEISE